MRPHAAALAVLLSVPLAAQTVFPPFNADWQALNLGTPTGINGYGGTAFAPGAPNVLLTSVYASGQIRAVPLTRDPLGYINGVGASTLVATVGGTDGGLAFGPGNVLFFTWYGPNRLGQILPGGTAASRVDDLAPLGVTGSVGSCTFVPAGMPGAGRLKLVTYGNSSWHDLPLTPDGSGTYTPGTATNGIQLSGGCEGVVYVPPGAPQIGGQVLVAEWNSNVISAYQVDANGDPIASTRQPLVGGFNFGGGGTIDPVNGDLVFLNGSGNVVVVRPIPACGTTANYGSASPGASGTPLLTAGGCARLGSTVTLTSDHAPNALGLLALGYFQLNVPYFNLTILQSLDASVVHVLNGSGDWSLNVPIPNAVQLGYAHVFWQTAYFDASTTSGLVSSAGLDMLIR